jgi:toxin ParE1/3/4
MGSQDLKVRWTRPALTDFIDIQQFIAAEDSEAARRIADRLWSTAAQLGDNPEIGRRGHVAGTREWAVTRTPFLVVYRIRNEAIEILRIWRGRQDWRRE